MRVIVRRSRLQAALAMMALLFVNAENGRSCICNQVYDNSTIVSNYDCGGHQWNLTANSTVIVYGAIGYGACTGNFTNCNCVFVEPGTEQASEQMSFQPQTSGAEVTFTVTNYKSTIELCEPIDGPCGLDPDDDHDPAGRKEIITPSTHQYGPAFISC